MAKHGLSHEGPQTTPALLSFLVGIFRNNHRHFNVPYIIDNFLQVGPFQGICLTGDLLVERSYFLTPILAYLVI